MSAPASVVLPEPVPPAITTLLSRIDGFTQDAGVRVAQDLVAYVIVERVEDLGRLAHDATRLSGNRRKESLEADSSDQEFAFNNRID